MLRQHSFALVHFWRLNNEKANKYHASIDSSSSLIVISRIVMACLNLASCTSSLAVCILKSIVGIMPSDCSVESWEVGFDSMFCTIVASDWCSWIFTIFWTIFERSCAASLSLCRSECKFAKHYIASIFSESIANDSFKAISHDCSAWGSSQRGGVM